MLRKKQSASVIGLEIKPWAIGLVELRPSEADTDLMNLDIWPVPCPSDRGYGWDETQRAKAAWELESKLEMVSITSQRLVASISTRDAWIRTLPVQPEDTDRILSEKAEQEAVSHLPDFEGNYVVDYELREDSGEGRKMVVVAARKTCVDRTRAFLDRLHLRLSVVDVDCFALERAYRWNYDPDEWTWIAHIRARETELLLLKNGAFRAVERIDIPVPHDLPECSSEIEELETRGEEFFYVLAKSLLKKAGTMIEAEASGEVSSTLMLSGPGAQVPPLVDCFRSTHPGPVKRLDPFRRIRIDPSIAYRAESLRHSVEEYSVPMGLALR
ncbi:MAG: pilus assembly protein PilM [Candidatus Latescibacteria bacterium]|nr:pilus assembly protein PilM [Candidatus Latescibacterota bacterium]